MTYTVAALYRFMTIADAPSLRLRLKAAFTPLDICGSLLVATEGINGTLAGSAGSIDAMIAILKKETGLSRDEVKFSTSVEKPFNRLKVRLKKEIVTLRQGAAGDPTMRVGTYVTPQEWDALIASDDVLLLDTRNSYETRMGIFKNAVDPNIESFTQFADYVRTQLDPARHKKVAMYCTGGIRCEKASAFMLAEGFEQVYHLQGGILKYLEDIPPDNSSWEGACYVFDKRMGVGHGLKEMGYSMCFCCGGALTPQDRAHPLYEEGVSCASCHASSSADDKMRFRTRQQQMTQQ